MKKLDAQRMVKKAKMSIMKYKPLALLVPTMLVGDEKFIEGNGTAYTDGFNVTYYTEFVETLMQKQVAYLVAHENFHKFLKHMFTGMGLWRKDPQLANIAADYIANGWIYQLDPEEKVCQKIEGALFDKKYLGKSMLEVFRELYEEKQKQPQSGQGQGDGQDDGQDDAQGQGNGQGSNQSQTIDDHGWGEAKEIMGNQEKRQEVTKQIDEAIRQGEMMSQTGTDPSLRKKLVDQATEIRVRWDDVLKEFMVNTMQGKDEQSFRSYNKRYLPSGLYLPVNISETLGEVVFSCDTSGSMGDDEILKVSKVIHEICVKYKPEKVRVLWWDTVVHGQQVFADGDYEGLLELLKPKGRGGTCAECVPKYLKENAIRPECVVMLTDGYLNPLDNKFGVPVLWLSTQNKEYVPSEGVMVKIEDYE